jgi:histidinol-phosphatase (PHP family)
LNLHTHTTYCDGSEDPVEYIHEAIELGWKHIGFSAHAPLPFQSEWAMKESQIGQYIKEIKTLEKHFKTTIAPIIGWEIDYLHGKGLYALKYSEISNAEYLICSIHYLPILLSDGKVVEYIEIDGTLDEFHRIYTYYNQNLKEILDLYLSNFEEMLNISISPKRIIGHIDKIVINAENYTQFKNLKKDFYESLFTILERQNRDSFILEINTRGLYKKNRHNPYPAFDFIKMIKDTNFKIMINSDAHHPCELNQGYDFVMEYLKQNQINLNWATIKD